MHCPSGLCAFPNAAFAAQIYDYNNVYDYNAMHEDSFFLSIRRPDSAPRNIMLARLLVIKYTTAPQRHMLPSPAGSLNTPPPRTASFSTHSSLSHIPHNPHPYHLARIPPLFRAPFLVKDLKRDLNVLCRLQLYIPHPYSYVISRSVSSLRFCSCSCSTRSSSVLYIHARLASPRLVSIRLFWSCLRVFFSDLDLDLDASSAVHALPRSDFSRFPFYESCY